MKKFAWKKCRKMFLEALFFAFEKTFFRVSVQNFGHCRLHEITGRQLSQCLSANHNPELRCVICTGVTLFALVLHLNCTALSQSESSTFFICIIKSVNSKTMLPSELDTSMRFNLVRKVSNSALPSKLFVN